MMWEGRGRMDCASLGWPCVFLPTFINRRFNEGVRVSQRYLHWNSPLYSFLSLALFFKLTHILIVVIIFFFIDHLHSPLGHPLTKNLLLTCAHLLKKINPKSCTFSTPGHVRQRVVAIWHILSPAHQKNHSFSSELWYRGVNQKHWIGLRTH